MFSSQICFKTPIGNQPISLVKIFSRKKPPFSGQWYLSKIQKAKYPIVVIENPQNTQESLAILCKGINHLTFQGSLYYQPKQCIVIREIPQNCHRFVLFDSPKMGNLMTPAFPPPQKKKKRRPLLLKPILDEGPSPVAQGTKRA